MNAVIIGISGLLFAVFGPKGAALTASGEMTTSFVVGFGLWFLVGAWVGTAVRLLPPKVEQVITFLGTFYIQTIRSISLTLPWPLGWVHATVSTATHQKETTLQIKSKDELVFDLPITVQYRVIDSKRYSIERENPEAQMVSLIVSSARSAANKMQFQAVYDDKESIQQSVSEHLSGKLATFGLAIDELVVEDPKLKDTTIVKLNSIREAQFDEQAAIHNANAIFARMTGEARAEAESLVLKAKAFQSVRLLAAEGNAAAIAVMQGKLGIVWENETVGEGDLAKTVKVARYVTPDDPRLSQNGAPIPETHISPADVLNFLRIIDSNDAIRDAAAKPGTVVVVPSGGGQNFGDIAAITRALESAGGHRSNGSAGEQRPVA